jgi:hypothetical protein
VAICFTFEAREKNRRTGKTGNALMDRHWINYTAFDTRPVPFYICGDQRQDSAKALNFLAFRGKQEVTERLDDG